jgi:type II secretory pathway component PulF
LDEVLEQTAALLDRDLKLKRSVIGALVYPAIVTGLIVVAIIVVVAVIVPRILKSVEGQLATLPMPTRVVQDVAYFFTDFWWLATLLVALGLYGAKRLYEAPGPRLAIDRFMLRVPILGKTLRDVAVARFTRTFGTLAGAGLPVLTCLNLTKGTLGNKALEKTTESIASDVSEGTTIAEPMERTGDFPPLLIQIVSLGERTGRLDEMLIHAADAFDRKVEQSIKVVTTILPPMLIMILACVVGFVVLAVMLPLIELQESIG